MSTTERKDGSELRSRSSNRETAAVSPSSSHMDATHQINFSITIPEALILNTPHVWNIISLIVSLARLTSLWMFSIIIVGLKYVVFVSCLIIVCVATTIYVLYKFTRFNAVCTKFYRACFDD